MVAINVRAVFVASQAAVAHMGEGGRIMAIGVRYVEDSVANQVAAAPATAALAIKADSADQQALQRAVAEIASRFGHPRYFGQQPLNGRASPLAPPSTSISAP
jgi:NAD(P)-dependent dehydrogenase (short-subunit alcohol dehydrogenase family)